jgi:tRNA dimethylallyltransferase
MTTELKPIIVLAGPTASGKSALSLKLAEDNSITIINADSMQFYQDIPIISAQPTKSDMDLCHHELYGIYPHDAVNSTGEFIRLATNAINLAHSSGKIPILVGGTGLYLKSLIYGIAAIPGIPLEVRNEARELCQKLGTEQFYQLLVKLDPLAAGRIRPSDAQRLVRCYEVMLGTGKSLFSWQKQPTTSIFESTQFLQIVLNPERTTLYNNCNQRFQSMIQNGAIEEVAKLNGLTQDDSLSVRKALGIREITGYLHNKITLNEAVNLAQTNTRHYAKRQMTWFRHQMDAAKIINFTTSKELQDIVPSLIKQFLHS